MTAKADDTVTATGNLLDLADVPSAPSYALPSDNESEVETDTVVNIQSFSKEELFQKFRAIERNAVRYRNKYKQVNIWCLLKKPDLS